MTSRTDVLMPLPDWMRAALATQSSLEEGTAFAVRGHTFIVKDGIPRSRKLISHTQAQTSETFGFKWGKRDTFDSPASLARMRAWLLERYGDIVAAPWLREHGERPLFVDAGCGAGMSALELVGPLIHRLRYLGVDVSDAVDVARRRFSERGLDAGFLQADISDLPLPANSVDLILCEGALHHTDSTEGTLKALAALLKPGGRFLFYVYRRKGPVREFTDDYVREKLAEMPADQAWRAMEPLTKLGIALGQLGATIDIAEPIGLLGIPAGKIDVQRLFYWHVAKAFYRPDLTFEEMNHINFDWYAPRNAHRQTPDEVRTWCGEARLDVERMVVEDAGITVIARKV